MSARMFAEHKATTDRLVGTLGKTRLVDDLAADDFGAPRADLTKQYGPVRLSNEVQKVRTVFKYGKDLWLKLDAIRLTTPLADLVQTRQLTNPANPVVGFCFRDR